MYYDRDVHREKTPAAYQDLVRQRQIRLKEVRDRGLDLYRLFAETLARGGFNAMICEDAATVSAGPGGFRGARSARPHPPPQVSQRCWWWPQTRAKNSVFFAIARTMNEEPGLLGAGFLGWGCHPAPPAGPAWRAGL